MVVPHPLSADFAMLTLGHFPVFIGFPPVVSCALQSIIFPGGMCRWRCRQRIISWCKSTAFPAGRASGPFFFFLPPFNPFLFCSSCQLPTRRREGLDGHRLVGAPSAASRGGARREKQDGDNPAVGLGARNRRRAAAAEHGTARTPACAPTAGGRPAPFVERI